MNSRKSLESVLKLARKYGATRLKYGEIEVELSAATPTIVGNHPQTEEMPTKDDLLFWSAPDAVEQPKKEN
jgi:hypothetical protein